MSVKKAQAGTLESNDIYIAIEEKPTDYGIQINLQSMVLAQFGESIKQTLLAAIKQHAIACGLEVTANDKGALTCTIEARMKTALRRADLLKENN